MERLWSWRKETNIIFCPEIECEQQSTVSNSHPLYSKPPVVYEAVSVTTLALQLRDSSHILQPQREKQVF